MEIKISKQKAEFNTSKLGNSKLCVVVEFPNCVSSTTNRSFKWMPTYKQLEQIKRALDEVEVRSWNFCPHAAQQQKKDMGDKHG